MYIRWKFNLIILFTNLSDEQNHFCHKEIIQNRRNSGSLFVMKLHYRNKSHLSIIECQFTSIPQKYSLKWKPKKKGQRRRVYSHILWPSLRKNTKTVQNSSTLMFKFSFLFRKMTGTIFKSTRWSLQCVQSTFTVLA